MSEIKDYTSEGPIEIRQLFETILSYRKLIIAIGSLGAILAFIATSFFTNPTYSASSEVTIFEEIFSTNIEASFLMNPIIPSNQQIVEIAESDALLNSLLDKPEIKEDLPNKLIV